METLLSILRGLLARLSASLGPLQSRLQQMSQRQRRIWLLAGTGACCILALTGTLLAFTAGQTAPPAKPRVAVATLTATATNTATATSTSTASPKPTQVVAPPPVVVQAALPPPPPRPTPPAATPPPPVCPTATTAPTPTATTAPTATASGTATATPSTTATATPVPTATPTATATPNPACQTCPFYSGNNPSHSDTQAAIFSAADSYRLPRNLVQAVAWQESKWHEDVLSCDSGVGLMQIQSYYISYFNGLHYSACGIGTTTYDAYTVQGNANLGAKVLAYLKCYYTFGGPYGGTASNPAQYSSEWYYFTATPPLAYPDTNASPSLCSAVFNDGKHPQFAALPSTTADPWGCPYSATAGDSALLDIVLSAYNAGPGAISKCGCIPNPGYVQYVEGYVPQFASGALPG